MHTHGWIYIYITQPTHPTTANPPKQTKPKQVCDNPRLDATERALLVEMCEPLLTAVAEAGYAQIGCSGGASSEKDSCRPTSLVPLCTNSLHQRRAAEEGVGYYEGHPTRVSLALMDEAGGARPDIVPLLRCLHEEGCPAAVQVRGWEVGGRWSVCGLGPRETSLVSNPHQTNPNTPTTTNTHKASALRILLTVRAAYPDLLWRDLVRLGFDRQLAFLLLTRWSVIRV